jgi:hypothetical protein
VPSDKALEVLAEQLILQMEPHIIWGFFAFGLTFNWRHGMIEAYLVI